MTVVGVGFALVKALGLVGSGGFGCKDRVSDLGEDMRKFLLLRRIWDSGGSLKSWGSNSAALPSSSVESLVGYVVARLGFGKV